MSHPHFLEPAYGQRSLGDVVPAVAAALGVPGAAEPTGLVLPDAASYVVFLIDGLGANLLTRYAHAAPYLSELLADQLPAAPATCGVPSTTATSLTSLGTGLSPGSHGLVGFTSRVPGTGKLLNALLWDQDVDPLEWQPHQTAFGRLQAAGVPVTVVNKREFERSGLTRAAHRGGDYVGADLVGERIAAAVASSAVRPSLTYLYDGDLDRTGHQWGVASSQWLMQLSMIDAEAEQLRETLPSHVRLVVIADHGMVDSPTDRRIDVDEHHELRDGVALMGGEARFRHLYCQRGAIDDVVATWSSVLGERAEVMTRSTAIGRGWFGPVDALVLPRLGDVVVACRSDHAILSTRDFAYEATLVGLHGSLTPDEMLIPLVVD
ncbi:alkaline phosphatase family protein [Nocardioides psychrotolerans]|uniref:Type I phosphodiesterase / nucleotide pyrophosphatase n=1 Tax=Nocardioides psychrotolerans TaxID=1005945 RepID=A0A1I3FR96_9ACTN|nr:nucleotide pyrophosphatase/phosphodiesterase family protein [Nocardioides psychrotolerans]GEP37266.1 alkaline phosphatase family protein [Nocardioides psychrotolerans]SFI13637.1 Type I phosphodiesterase / nucleotide pyrophosphatase [Nocardioides psychrotolerans]